MNKRFEAKIYWLSEADGGRKALPSGDKYAPQIYITKPRREYDEFWSIFVFNKKIISDRETLAELKYLSDTPPTDLAKDVEFELREGNRTVAKGIVLNEILH